MKRTLAFILAALIVAASLASCASPAQTAAISPNICITSSDAGDAAAWLDSRLGERLTGEVVIGTDADGYALDLSALEADGYFIRSFGREDVLFARTADGLDRAVRKYAKMVEAGAVSDVTYHEGYRVERLTVAGNDVSEYAIAVEGESAYLRRRVTSVAATGFRDLVKYACGASVEIGGDAEHKIVFRETNDPTFAESTYSYRVEGGDLIFEYSGLLGALYGVYALLEDECGWAEISFGDDELAESDRVELAEGLHVTVTPAFRRFFEPYDCGYHEKINMKYTYTAATRAMYDCFGSVPVASHGLSNNQWGGIAPSYHTRQICYTDAAIFDTVENALLDHIEERLALGDKIGDELRSLDVSQADNLRYCKCKNCLGVYAEEDGAWSGAVVRWANSLAADIEAEGYGGIDYLIFAYHGTNKPCLTKPRSDVFVTLCLDGSCYRHLLDGSQCRWESFDMAGYWGKDVHLNNVDYASWMRGWGELCDSDNLYVWYYTLNNNIRSYTLIGHMWEDFNFIADCGAAGLFWEGEEFEGFGVNALQYRLAMQLQLHPDMTKNEFTELVGEYFRREFGDGWREICRAVGLWEDAQLAAQNCANCWGYAGVADYAQLDWDIYAAHFDEMLALLDTAIGAADSEKQERAVKRLSLTFIYNGCFGEFFRAYEANDAATLATLDGLWALLIERFAEVGIDPHAFRGIGFDPELSICDTLEETAFTYWLAERAKFFPEGTELSPVPSEYAQ